MRSLILMIFIISILGIGRCYDIKLYWQFEKIDKNIFDSYPDIYQKYGNYSLANHHHKSKVSKSNHQQSSPKQIQTDKSIIQSAKNTINSIIQKVSNIETSKRNIMFPQPVKLSDSKSQKRCSLQKVMFEQEITHFTKLDYTFNNLHPGLLVELVDPANFAKGIIPVYDNYSIKNPINIRLKGQNFQYRLSNISSYNQYRRQLQLTLAINLRFLNSRPIKFYILPAASRTETALRKLGLGSSIYQKIFIAGGSQHYSHRTEYYTGGNRVAFVLHQSFFSSVLDFSDKLSQNNNKTLFDQIYLSPSQRLKQKFMMIQDRHQMLPQLISQANYGRLLVVSLIDDKNSQQIIDKMAYCFNKQVLINEECFNLVTKQIRGNPTLRYYYAGIDQNIKIQQSACYICKKQLKWKSVFFNIDQQSVQSLKPISVNTINFLQQRRKQIDRRYYSILNCQIDVTLLIDNLNVDEIQVTITGNLGNSKLPFNIKHARTYQIGSYVGNQPFQLNLVTKIAKKRSRSFGLNFFFLKKKPIYSIQYQFAILVNGEQKIRDVIGISRSDLSSSRVRVFVDPINGRTSIQKTQ